jgi:hypothetical protein
VPCYAIPFWALIRLFLSYHEITLYDMIWSSHL